MKIYLARHGETISNRKGIILGRNDSPPTASGLAESRKLTSLIPYEGTGIIFSSPLGRALATAAEYSAPSGWEVIILDGLMELACGEWEGLPRHSVLENGRPLRSTWTDKPPGGESCAEAEGRVGEAIRHIKGLPYDNILIIGHAAVNQIFLKIWLALEPRAALMIHHPHDLIYRIDDQHVSWLKSTGAAGTGLITGK